LPGRSAAETEVAEAAEVASSAIAESPSARIAALGRNGAWREALVELAAARRSPLDGRSIEADEQRRCANAAMSACERSRQWERSLAILHELWEDSDVQCRPNVVSYNAAITGCARGSRWQLSETLLDEMRSRHLTPEILTYNATLNSYEKGSKWQQCLGLLRSMSGAALDPDVHSYGAVLAALARGGDWQRGLECMEEMRQRSVVLDLLSYSSLMNACLRGGAWEHGLQLLAELRRSAASAAATSAEASGGPVLDQITFENALALCRPGGLWESAVSLLDEMRAGSCQPSVASYVSALRACEQHEALEPSSEPLAALKASLLSGMRASAVRLLSAKFGEDAAGADDWRGSPESAGVHVVVALDTLHRHGRLDAALEAMVRAGIYEPFMEALRRPPQTGSVSMAAQEVPALVAQAGLGTFFTAEALGALGLASGVATTWLTQAQTAVASALVSAARREAGAEAGRAALAAQLPEEPSGQRLVVWTSYSLGEADVREKGRRSMWILKHDGRVVAHGRHKWQEGEALLPPLFVGHSRGGHAERRALLQIAERILQNAAAAGPDAGEPSGTVRLYASHTPCVSCLACFAQFRRLFPRVKLVVAFAAWDETRVQVLNSVV